MNALDAGLKQLLQCQTAAPDCSTVRQCLLWCLRKPPCYCRSGKKVCCRSAGNQLPSCLALQTIAELEEATGGYVLHQSGRSMILYRGQDWVKPQAAAAAPAAGAQAAQLPDGQHCEELGHEEQQAPDQEVAETGAVVPGEHGAEHCLRLVAWLLNVLVYMLAE